MLSFRFNKLWPYRPVYVAFCRNCAATPETLPDDKQQWRGVVLDFRRAPAWPASSLGEQGGRGATQEQKENGDARTR
jgi:hypothetical protein